MAQPPLNKRLNLGRDLVAGRLLDGSSGETDGQYQIVRSDIVIAWHWESYRSDVTEDPGETGETGTTPPAKA